MKVYDCFPFNDEVEILKTRILYLEEVVSHFVIAEGNMSFSGKPKEFYSKQVIDELSIDPNRFILVRYEFPENLLRFAVEKGYRWDLERFARASLKIQIDRIHPDDRVILSDVDEIPSKDQIIKSLGNPFISRLSTPLYYGKINWRVSGNEKWLTVKIGPAASFHDLNQIRYAVLPIGHGCEGAHFSTLYSGFEDIKKKSIASAHAEFDVKDDHLEPLVRYSDKYKVDYQGRFFRSGMGLTKVIPPTRFGKDFSEQQIIFSEIAPKFLDYSPTPKFHLRVCASYNVTQAWRKKRGGGPVLEVRESYPLFLKALAHYYLYRTFRLLKRFVKRAITYLR